MDQCNQGPPIFDEPPSPPLNIIPANQDQDLANRNFIIQCINNERQKAKAKTAPTDDCEKNAIPFNSDLDTSDHNRDRQHTSSKRARSHYVQSSKYSSAPKRGVLRFNSNTKTTQQYHDPSFALPDTCYDNWHFITTQNNIANDNTRDKWRESLAFPIDLNRRDRLKLCSRINDNWRTRYDLNTVKHSCLTSRHGRLSQPNNVKFMLPSHQCQLNASSDSNYFPIRPIDSNANIAENVDIPNKSKRKRSSAKCPAKNTQESHSKSDLLHDIQCNLQSRAAHKVTKIATWNINNGFDHLAIASFMAKKDIDILALQEPRISHSTTDDIWISTMRNELRKCKYEIITSRFSYLIFDEQTSGAALASIIRQTCKVQGRLLSVTFKSNDIWEVHSVISIYAVTNAKSGKKYARSNNSRKDVNSKLTKALDDEILYLKETFGDAPITIVGDFQDTIHTDQRDNIGLVGKKMHPNGPLQMLLHLGFQSAYHLKHPKRQQVTRWNSARTAGRHIDLQMLNESAASLLVNITIDDSDSRNFISSDHLIVIAQYNIEKTKQDIVDSYRTRINFRKIAGIKMKLEKKQIRHPTSEFDLVCYNLAFDQQQFMSTMVQDQLKCLERWQLAANSSVMIDILSSLEASMQALEDDTVKEDNIANALFDSYTSPVQRKLVERNLERRAHIDSIYDTFQGAIHQLAVSLKIVSNENKHIDALCTRQKMKLGKIKRYGDSIINLTAPTSKIRSALGDLKHAEATLRNLQHGITNPDLNATDRNLQKSFSSLAKNVASFQIFQDASSQLSQSHEEHINNESAVSTHRALDAFSGRWEECKFSSDICKTLISQANGILCANNVKQRIGVRHLDQTMSDDDPWSDLTCWWNGPELSTLATTLNPDTNAPEIADAIQTALTKTRKLKKKAMQTLIQNKEKILIHASRMNHTRQISQRLNPKLMDEPEAHHVVLDPNNIHASSTVRCNSFQQCLDNSLLYHQNWMDRSGSTWEHHWFKTTSKYGHINGITFNFNGKPSDADFQQLVSGHQECSESIKKAFQDAHSDEIASVMQPPTHPHRALDWNWHPKSSEEDWSTFTANYWKAIGSIPGKARHNGYTMAVIGRLPRRWIDLHLRMMKMMMVLRILPKKTKFQARVPIPKPKPGETRPLSLINDDMCFILGFMTQHYTLQCEAIKLIPPTLHAYRQGMSTSFITLIDLATREDALSFGRYMALTAEDEEKFFDRVSLEVQLAVLFILGFPMEGFLEMKAEDMDNISVEIHTRHGQAIGKFLHGLKQGSPLSCLISNLVLIFKHRVWGLQDPLSKVNDPNGYTMSTWNKFIDGDNPPLISMEGFCDDNSKWNMGDGQDFASMIQAVKWNLKLAGDLSMIFKIGRRGDKTIIELFNVDLQDIHHLPADGFTSVAWDFKANRPTKEEVDCRVYLKSGSIIPPTKPAPISDPVWNMILKGCSLKSERSLGIWRNKLGDTSDSAEKRAFLFGTKIDRLNLPNLKNDKTIKIAINSLIVPVYQFGILENRCCPEVYDKMDITLINKVRKAMGFAWCDAKQLIFVPENHFGMGIRSVSVEMLKSICRELEIQLNDDELIGKVIRGRLEAFKDASFRHARNASFATYDNITQGVRNFIMEAIRHIAQFGFFIRDMSDAYATYHTEAAINLAQSGLLFKTFRHNTLGMCAYTGSGSRSGTTLGTGDTKLLWSIIYGRCHTLINDKAIHSKVKLNFSSEQMQSIKTKALEILQDDLQALYTIYEWSDNNIGPLQHGITLSSAAISLYESSINNTNHWRRISALSCLKQSHDEDVISVREHFAFLDGLLNLSRRVLLTRIDSLYIQPNRLRLSDIDSLMATGWPLIIATDGGADKSQTTNMRVPQPNASASVVIFHPPATPFENFMKATTEEKEQILNQNLLPWRARACSMPTKIGDTMVDNAHAECYAIILMEEWIPLNIPILLIMDSEAERDRYVHLQNLQHTTNRFLKRSLMSGVSKCLGSRLSNALKKHLNQNDNMRLLFASNISPLCSHAKNWCYTASGDQSLWKTTQWQPGQLRTVWAIRSHQLKDDFTISPKNRYGTQLVPNRTFVSANQWADNICNSIMRFQRNAINSSASSEMRKWCTPAVTLGITSPNFIITFNGVCLDRCVSNAAENACTKEFIRRLALRPTQGLFIRLQHDLYLKPEMIGRHSYHRRYIEGKTKTHTRAIYTDAAYRQAIVYTYAMNESWSEDHGKIQYALKEATKNYRYLRCPFCVSKIEAGHTSHIFHQHATVNSGLFGNSRHYRYYCLNEQIMEVRQQMTQLLENHLTELFRIASKWGRTGFSTLLERATKAIIMLDRSAFYNTHSMNPAYTKSHQDSFACLATHDWISFLESQTDQVESFAKQLFYQWPLVHQLGFIAANSYTVLEMPDGEYSPCDLLPLGLIPLALQDVMSQFANELGARHSLEAKKDFIMQWHQVRAVALLRAISVAMVTGAQISEHKSKITDTAPAHSLSRDTAEASSAINPRQMFLSQPELTRKNRISAPAVDNNIDQFYCEGLTCSPIFTSKTNLRSSLMRRKGDTCRRCVNLQKAIDCTKSIESTLENNQEVFKTFYNSTTNLDSITVDVIVDAISQLIPRPPLLLPSYLRRATKRNVFPIVMMNIIRLLQGTFQWKMTNKPTSIDVVLNHQMESSGVSQKQHKCICDKEKTFFAVNLNASCLHCNGSSSFLSITSRLEIAQSSLVEPPSLINQESTVHTKQRFTQNAVKRHKNRSRISNTQSNIDTLRDITNLTPRTPLCLASRPNVTEINNITKVNNMLSNFVVTYFFNLLAHNFSTILHEEFLFDLVKSEGSWKLFVATRRQSNHYSIFFKNLLNHKFTCIIPICYQAHWSILIRRFIGNAWKIFFLDSIVQGSEQRFNDWKILFQDDDTFSGDWIKVKILPQSELECGARVCLHGVCFSLSKKKHGDIINDLSRFKDLAARSRLMVSHICKDGKWSHPKWLSRTIGAENVLLE